MSGTDYQVVRAIREAGAGRWMMFVDGENFTMSFQRLVEPRGLSLKEGPHYVPNSFVWSPTLFGNQPFNELRTVVPDGVKALRSYFYTSVTGDEDAVNALRETIWNRAFTPEVFKRPKNGRGSKGVDIALARDLLVHSFEDHLDLAILVAGDADYLPLVQEVKRRGKRLILAFFGSSPSLASQLRLAADAFVDIEPSMVRQWQANSVSEAPK